MLGGTRIANGEPAFSNTQATIGIAPQARCIEGDVQWSIRGRMFVVCFARRIAIDACCRPK
jgi:hypothetical protein